MSSMSSRFSYQLIIFPLVLFVIVFLLWASLMELDESVHGTGKVVPSGQIQQIQHLEGGIISEILVKEGQFVKYSTVIYRIRNEYVQSNLSSLQITLYASMAAEARLRAQLAGAQDVQFPPELIQNVPDLVENERKLFMQRLQNNADSIQVLRDQADQSRAQLAEARSNARNLTKEIELAREQVRITQTLMESGAGSRRDYLDARQRLQSVTTQQQQTENSIPALERSIAGADSKIAEARTRADVEAQTQLSQVLLEMGKTREEIIANKDRVSRNEIVAPVDGTIKTLMLHTIGGIVKPGETVAELLPSTGKLIVEAQIKPADRGRLWVGQNARIGISAYDSSIYGRIDAVITEISADTIVMGQTQLQEEYYKVMLEADKINFGEDKPILPGMTADINIVTGKHTIMRYLLKPILKSFGNSLNEP